MKDSKIQKQHENGKDEGSGSSKTKRGKCLRRIVGAKKGPIKTVDLQRGYRYLSDIRLSVTM